MKKLILIIVPLGLVLVIGGVLFLRQLGPQEEKAIEQESPSPVESPPMTESPEAPTPVSEALINQQLEDYLPQQVLEINYNGRVFCSHYLYGYDENKETGMIKAYVWAYCEEYYLDNGELKMGSGGSFPVLVSMEVQNGILGVHGHQVPKEGSLYAPSIREMFPEKYAEEAILGYDIELLKPSPKEQAQAYYGD